ncbi:MAG: amidohydrolase family protein, partial [Armatimonadetes bacterium]|nr:amidohydrolase family protein [Akkermansiaceae bacterium]
GNPLRHRVEHATLCPPDCLQVLAKSGIIAVIQPQFILSDAWLPLRLGDRMRDAYVFGDMHTAGVRLALSSDAPVEIIDPQACLAAAIQGDAGRRGTQLTSDSAISAYTLASDLAIEEAKSHLLARDSDKAALKIKTATEIWPTNPKLEEFRTLVNNSGGVVTARNDFDRLLSEGNYREIAKRQYELAPAIQGDATREDAFKQIMENLQKIEAALGKASEFSRIGQNYGAWEQLADIREQFPDDPKLGRELELLAPKVADFTLALDKARQFENRTPKQTGSSLTWYLKARNIHPQSDQAEKGIQRLLDEILPEK